MNYLKSISNKTKFWIVIYVIVSIFVLSAFIKYSNYFSKILSKSHPILLILSLIFMSLSFLIMGFAWRITIYFQGYKNNTKKILYYFFVSQIVRYIPGNVWSIMARFYWHQKLGIKKKHISYSYGIEVVLMLLTAGLIVLLTLYKSEFYTKVTQYISLPLFFALISLAILISMPILKKYISKRLGLHQYIQTSITYIFYWIAFGISLYYTCLAYNINKSFIILMGINTLAWLIGYLSILTPSGLGIREAVMITLLNILGVDIGTGFLIAITARIIFTLGESIDTLILHYLDKGYIKISFKNILNLKNRAI